MAQSVLEWLVAEYPSAKKETLKRMVMDGRVMINDRPAKHVNQALQPNDRLTVAARPSRELASIHPLQIVFEDADLLVVNKPAGLLTSTTPDERRPTALALVNAYVADRERRSRVGLIHRLDAPASGLLVFSKSSEAYESLKRQLFKHEVRRTYAALVHGVPKPRSGTIQSQLVEHADGHVESTKFKDRGVKAVTHYEVIRETQINALLRVNLETGRKHQIRVHFSERGWPIVGDRDYGPQPPKSDLLQLCAIELEFVHPRTNERVAFQVPIPPMMTNMIL